jgi:arylsulfatase A-like enzyme
MDLHLPYTQNPYYAEFLKNSEHSFFRTRKILVDDIRLYTEKNCLSPDEKKDIIALYDSQVRFVDSAVKEIAATLKKKNLYRDTLIIVTSDHGEEFWDHNNFEHGHTVYNELLHVPIIMAGNRLKHAVIKKPVNLIDILPTLLHFAHISVANLHISGKNLLKGSPKPIFSLGTLYGDEKYCLIKDNMKIIRNTGRKKGKKGLAGYRSNEKFELYDLAIDPFETHNLRLEKPDLFLKLKKELQKYKKSGDPLIGKKILPEKDSELKEKLKSLGYL